MENPFPWRGYRVQSSHRNARSQVEADVLGGLRRPQTCKKVPVFAPALWSDEAQVLQGMARQVFRLQLEEAIVVSPSINAISLAAQDREPQVCSRDFNDSLAQFEALMTLVFPECVTKGLDRCDSPSVAENLDKRLVVN